MNTDKLAINRQNFPRVRLQLKFAFIIRPLITVVTVETVVSSQSYASSSVKAFRESVNAK